MSDRSFPAGWRPALRAAFPHTLPILTGYLALGIAYGILLSAKGYGVGWAFLSSLCIYAGSMQFVAASMVTLGFHPLSACLMTLMVNARHIFYGVSMLERYRGIGKCKPYLIFGLSDETFSLVCSTDPPEGISRSWFYLWITLLNHSYWVAASVIGSMIGSWISFDTAGIDFVLTAMFVVIFLDQWRTTKRHGPVLIGLGASLLCLLVLGPDDFLIPSMLLMLVIVTLFRRRLEGGEPT